jgi:hypothetical protein
MKLKARYLYRSDHTAKACKKLNAKDKEMGNKGDNKAKYNPNKDQLYES